MAIIMFVNLKGGVAKTTNAVAVAECLAAAGHRTLVIDADHQCAASELLIGENRLQQCDDQKTTLHDLLRSMLDDRFNTAEIPKHMVSNVSNINGGLENLSVIPCSLRIDEFHTNVLKARRDYGSSKDLNSVFASRRTSLKRWLRKNFDYTIIDCPPSIATQVRALVTASDCFIVPSIPDQLSVRGSHYLIDRLRRMNSKIPGLGTLWSLYRSNVQTHRNIISDAENGRSQLDRLPRPFKTVIPHAAAIAAAVEPDKSPSSFVAKYESKFAKLYRELCDEIIHRSKRFHVGSEAK